MSHLTVETAEAAVALLGLDDLSDTEVATREQARHLDLLAVLLRIVADRAAAHVAGIEAPPV